MAVSAGLCHFLHRDISRSAAIGLEFGRHVGGRVRQKVGLGLVAAKPDGGLVAGDDFGAGQDQDGVAAALEGQLPDQVVPILVGCTGKELHVLGSANRE